MRHSEGRLHDRYITTGLPVKIKSADGGGHAFEQRIDTKKHEADAFAQRFVHYLQDAHNAGKFEQLLIIAEPTFLGLLRHHLPEPVKKRIVFDRDKNITTQDAADISKHLQDDLPSL